jgi:lysozyme
MLDAIIDLSHHNGEVDLVQAKQDGILGIIHKATQGITLVDPAYQTNREKATAAGLLWGAYHFAIPGAGTSQADHFLETVEPTPETLIALDLEATKKGLGMSLIEARAFVSRIFEKLGRWPGLYGGGYLKGLLRGSKDPVLGNCWLWLSQYGEHPVIPSTWPLWTLWQYTDGTSGPDPRQVKGIGVCDRNQFNGDLSGLHRLWGVASADSAMAPTRSEEAPATPKPGTPPANAGKEVS